MGRVWICEECSGLGLHGFDRGPVAERCQRCQGAGVLFADTSSAARDFYGVLTGLGGLDMTALGEGASIRALALLLARIEERCEALESALERPR
jgi:hypothetical protein